MINFGKSTLPMQKILHKYWYYYHLDHCSVSKKLRIIIHAVGQTKLSNKCPILYKFLNVACLIVTSILPLTPMKNTNYSINEYVNLHNHGLALKPTVLFLFWLPWSLPFPSMMEQITIHYLVCQLYLHDTLLSILYKTHTKPVFIKMLVATKSFFSPFLFSFFPKS